MSRFCPGPPAAGGRADHPVWAATGTAMSGKAIPAFSFPSASTAGTYQR